jgi:ribosomal protein S18 acetylase RimI-like enzyme
MASLGRRTFTETFGHLYRPEDLAAFLTCHNPEAWAAEIADPAFSIRLAEADGEPAAYVKVGPPSLPFHPGRRRAVELRQLYVLKPWQGAGIAPGLMDWALAEACARGAEDIYLSVYIDNHRARRFYARYGFVEVGKYPFRVGNHIDDDRIMKLALVA